MLKGEASDVDVIAEKMLEVGGNHLLSVILPLCRAVFKYEMAPEV